MHGMQHLKVFASFVTILLYLHKYTHMKLYLQHRTFPLVLMSAKPHGDQTRASRSASKLDSKCGDVTLLW